MNYLNLVLDGYLIENNRDHLTDFFASEFKKAERDHFISADLFFDGCIKIIDQLKLHLKEKVIEQKRELYLMLTEMQKGTIEVDGKKGKAAQKEYEKHTKFCNEQLADERPDGIGDLTFNINLFHITHGQRFGQLTYFDVLTIEDSIREAKERVNGLSYSMKSKDSTSAKSKAGKLTQDQIALIYYFDGEIISPNNADLIAAEYGFTSKGSGHKIYQRFLYWSNKTNRHANEDMTNKVLNNKITKFESIKPYIQDEKNTSRLLDEIQALRIKLNPDYKKK